MALVLSSLSCAAYYIYISVSMYRYILANICSLSFVKYYNFMHINSVFYANT